MTTSKSTKGGQMRKRGRTSYSPKELEILEKYFKKNPYLNPTLRGYLCKLLGYNASQLKVWYQNRRMRLKKECCKQEQAAAAAGEDGVSSSGSDDNRRIVAQLRSRSHNRSEGTSSGSFPTSFPLNSSMDNHEDNSLSGTPGTEYPSVPHNSIHPPPSNLDVFRPLQPNYQNSHGLMNHSAPTPMVRGNAHGSAPQPRPEQLHHSLYTGSQIPRRPQTQFPDSYPRYGQNLMNQNQPHLPAYPIKMELGSMRHANAGNFMYRHTNDGYRMLYDHRDHPGRIYASTVRPHYPGNSSYTREDQNDFDLRADFSRLRFTEMCSTESTSPGNPYEWQKRNGVKVEYPPQPFTAENSGFSKPLNHYVPNNFNMNLNFPAPGITANTYPHHPSSSFNQASAYYPPQTWDMHATDMNQAFNNHKRYLSEPDRFLESPNINLPGCSTNETYYLTMKSDENPKQSFPGPSCLDTSVNSCHEQPEKYMDCLSPETSELSLASCDGNPNCEIDTRCNISEESGIPSWEQIFTEPFRKLENLNDIECSAQSTSNTPQSFMASQADASNSMQP